MRLSMMVVLLTLVSCGGGNGGGGNGTNASSPVQEPRTQQTEDVTVSENATFELELKRKTELNEDRSNLEEFKKNINTHLVKVKALTGNYKDSSVVCEKTHFDGTKTKYSGSFDARGLSANVEIQLIENDPALVTYDCSLRQFGQELDRTDVKILKSFVVSDKKNYADFIAAPSIGTLLIEEKGELSTDGLDLDLKVKDLISLKGKLVTFPVERVAETSDNRPGLSGGKIVLEAEKASGDLYIELRGLNGGKITRIPNKIEAIPPKAADGQCPRDREVRRNDQRCVGKPGQKGYPGIAGYPGMPGGDAGLLVFTTIKKSDINLSVKHFPGAGSEGGVGGEGGIGGQGGIGSHVRWHEPKDVGPRCPMCAPSDNMNNSNLMTGQDIKFPNGSQGAKGDTGARGESGSNGKISDSKVTFTEEQMEFIFNYDWKNFN